MTRAIVLAAILAMLGVATDARADNIGGFVFTKGTVANARQSLLNPGEAFAPSYDSGELAAMASGDWSDFSFRIRGQIGLDNPQVDSGLRIEELYYSHEMSDAWSFAVGKQTRSWDSGLSYQPLGFFRSENDLTDPFDQESRISGLPMLVVSRLGEDFNLEAIVSDQLTDGNKAQVMNARQWAVRVSHAFTSGLNASILLRQRDGAAPGVGASASYGFDTVELHADVFYGPQAARYVHRGVETATPPMLYVANPFVFRANGSYALDSVVGMTWTPIDQLAVYAEWDHKGDGLSNSQWRRFQTLVDAHAQEIDGTQSALALENLGWDLGVLGNNGTRRDYGYAMVSYGIQPEAISLSTYVDLADGSAVSTLSIGLPLPSSFLITANITTLTGNHHSDFGISPYRAIGSLRLTYDFD